MTLNVKSKNIKKVQSERMSRSILYKKRANDLFAPDFKYLHNHIFETYFKFQSLIFNMISKYCANYFISLVWSKVILIKTQSLIKLQPESNWHFFGSCTNAFWHVNDKYFQWFIIVYGSYGKSYLIQKVFISKNSILSRQLMNRK